MIVPTVGTRVSLRRPSHDTGFGGVLTIVFTEAAQHDAPAASNKHAVKLSSFFRNIPQQSSNPWTRRGSRWPGSCGLNGDSQGKPAAELSPFEPTPWPAAAHPLLVQRRDFRSGPVVWRHRLSSVNLMAFRMIERVSNRVCLVLDSDPKAAREFDRLLAFELSHTLQG